MWRTAASLALLLLLLFVLLGTYGKLAWWMWTEKSPRLMLCFCPPSGITEEATLFSKVHLTWMIPIIVILIIHSAPSKAAWRPPPPTHNNICCFNYLQHYSYTRLFLWQLFEAAFTSVQWVFLNIFLSKKKKKTSPPARVNQLWQSEELIFYSCDSYSNLV